MKDQNHKKMKDHNRTKTKLDASESLPPIPEKRYFSIGEVSRLCAVKPHVLRYWEQEFTALRPSKRRGNRRYYQLKDIQLVRQIRKLLYMDGFTIQGARLQLQHAFPAEIEERGVSPVVEPSVDTGIAPLAPMDAAGGSGNIKTQLDEIKTDLSKMLEDLGE